MNPAQSIFGIEAPKFVYSAQTVLLDYASVIKDEPQFDRITKESIITGHRARVNQHYHWSFEVMINLFKYTDPKVKFDEIYAHKNNLVTLYRRHDNDCFRNDDDEVVLFKLSEIIPTWIDSPIFPDQLLLKFVSADPVNISKCTVEL